VLLTTAGQRCGVRCPARRHACPP